MWFFIHISSIHLKPNEGIFFISSYSIRRETLLVISCSTVDFFFYWSDLCLFKNDLNIKGLPAERHRVAREKNLIKKVWKKSNFLAYNIIQPPISVHKKISPIDPAVWPAIDNIFIYIRMSCFVKIIIFLVVQGFYTIQGNNIGIIRFIHF